MKTPFKGGKNKTVVSWLSRKYCGVLGVLMVVMHKKMVRRAKNLAIKRYVYDIHPNVQEVILGRLIGLQHVVSMSWLRSSSVELDRIFLRERL